MVSGKNKRVLGVFTLAMMNVAIIMSLRALPMMAKEGFSLVFFYVFGAIMFLIPTAFVSAELATGWADGGGVYTWVKEAFSQKLGFMAIWIQWIQNVIWYPTVLAFAGGALAFMFNPAIVNNKIYMLVIILGIYWGATLANFRGMKLSGRISTIGVLGGTILPGVVIILLGSIWLGTGNPSEIPLDVGHLMPDIGNLSGIALLAGTLLTFAGMEVSAVHANEVKDPEKSYPKAIFLSVGIILVVFIVGSLAVAIIMTPQQLAQSDEMVAGVMVAFTNYFKEYKIMWAVPIFAFLITMGVVAGVTSWIIGPSKGLFKTAKHGLLPPFMQHKNKNGIPTHILIIQGSVVTVLSLVFLFMPNVDSSFWILTALTAQLYLIMYVMLYAAGIKLRYSQPNVKRAYRVPGGNLGMWIIAGAGIVGALFAILLGFVPPAQIDSGSLIFFEAFLVTGIFIMCGAPLLIYHFRKPSWIKKGEG